MKGLLAKFLIHFEMWRDLKPLGFERERERTRGASDGEKGKKMSLTLFREIFKMDKCLRFKNGI